MNTRQIFTSFVMAFFAIFSSAKAEPAPDFSLAGVLVESEVNYATFRIDTSSLAGNQLEGSQFVSSSEVTAGTLFAIFSDSSRGVNSGSMAGKVLASYEVLPETDESLVPTGNWLIEPHAFTSEDQTGATFFSPNYTTFLSWEEQNLGKLWLVKISGSPSMISGLVSGELTYRGYFAAIPEPSSYVAIFGVLALGFTALRRRR